MPAKTLVDEIYRAMEPHFNFVEPACIGKVTNVIGDMVNVDVDDVDIPFLNSLNFKI